MLLFNSTYISRMIFLNILPLGQNLFLHQKKKVATLYHKSVKILCTPVTQSFFCRFCALFHGFLSVLLPYSYHSSNYSNKYRYRLCWKSDNYWEQYRNVNNQQKLQQKLFRILGESILFSSTILK